MPSDPADTADLVRAVHTLATVYPQVSSTLLKAAAAIERLAAQELKDHDTIESQAQRIATLERNVPNGKEWREIVIDCAAAIMPRYPGGVHYDDMEQMIRTLLANVATLERELAEARRDTKRLDWLESIVRADRMPEIGGFLEGAICPERYELEPTGADIRAAIDAATASAPQSGSKPPSPPRE